jgi:hypothetical protein
MELMENSVCKNLSAEEAMRKKSEAFEDEDRKEDLEYERLKDNLYEEI